MRFRLSRPLSLVLLTLAAWTGSAACGGNVIVDGAGGNGAFATGASDTGATGTGATGTGATGTGATGTGTDTFQVPDAGGANAACEPTYLSLIGNLESAIGCAVTANIPQCTGMYLLPDPCGCMHVVNDAHPDLIMFGENLWLSCEAAGCCGPQAGVGCSPCPPDPTGGVCEGSQCVAE